MTSDVGKGVSDVGKEESDVTGERTYERRASSGYAYVEFKIIISTKKTLFIQGISWIKRGVPWNSFDLPTPMNTVALLLGLGCVGREFRLAASSGWPRVQAGREFRLTASSGWPLLFPQETNIPHTITEVHCSFRLMTPGKRTG